tara:strand:- start:2114 stop:3211 length:1098 start_codon:yes stop_codon:yes gene_type:complete
MKILHVSTIIEWRGGDNQMLTTYSILEPHLDLQQFIFCPLNSVLQKKCIELNIPHFTAKRDSKYSLTFISKLYKTIKEKDIEVLHVHDSKAFSMSLLIVTFFPSLKLVYSRKRNNKIHKNFFKILKYNHKRIDRIICVSQAVKDVLMPILNNDNKVEVIYDGINVEKFSKSIGTGILRENFGIPKETLLIGNIAGLTRQKDLFTFLNTAQAVLRKTDKDLKFLIIGQGPLEKELKEYTKSLGIEKHVIFTGFRNDISLILPELDLFLLSSETEGLPLSIMEAFAAQIPVVATAAGGTGEAIKNEITGMISPIKDPEKLALNTLKIINNSELRSHVIRNALALVNSKFTLEIMQRNYYRFYKSLSN